MINTILIISETITFVTILKYYGLLCLMVLPISLPTMIIVSRKTNLMDRFDKFIDNLWTDGKKQVPEPAKKDSKESADKNEENKPEEDIDELNLAGVTTFEMPVGKTYRCYLNYQNRGGGLGAMDWYMENEFIGTISKDGLFKALKVGTANIYCAPKDSAYDSGSQAYSIKVAASNEKWFAEKAATWIEEHKGKIDVVTALISRKINEDNAESGIMLYEGSSKENSDSFSVQFDKQNKLIRCLFVLHSSIQFKNQLVEDLNERMEEVKLEKTDGTRIWIHEIIDNEHEEVDYYAFLREAENGKTYLGIGQSWRDYGEKEEFLQNISMSLRMFMKMTGWKSVPELIAEIEDEKADEDETTSDEKPETVETTNELKNEPEPPKTEPAEEYEHQDETSPEENDDENSDVDFKEDIDQFQDFNEEENYSD